MFQNVLLTFAVLVAFSVPLYPQRSGMGSGHDGFHGGGMGGRGMGGRGGLGGPRVRDRFGAQPAVSRIQPQPGLHIGLFTRFGHRVFFGGNGFFVERRRVIIDPPAGQLAISGQTFASCPPFRLALRSGQPPALLVFRDGSIYEAQNFLIDAGCVHYRTTYGGTNTVPLAALNLEDTRKRNAARSIAFDVPAEEPKPTK